MISEDTLTNLRDYIRAISEYTVADLVKREAWGTITFDSVKQHITYAINMTSLLAQMPLEALTDQAAHDLQSQMPAVASLFANIDGFGIEEGNAKVNRDQISSQVKNAVEQMHESYSRWIPYLAYARGDIDKNMGKIEDTIQGAKVQFNNAIQEAKVQLDDAKTYHEERSREIDRIVEATRTAVASAGVTPFARAFDEEAEKLARESQKWFRGMIVCSALAVGAIVLLYFWPTLSDNANTWQIVRNGFMKVSALAVLFNGIVWCGRMYRAKSHQATVNRHRALSLKTFQAFVEVSDDSRTRDAVLLAATKSVFANVSTGLVGERASGEDPSVQILEIGKQSME